MYIHIYTYKYVHIYVHKYINIFIHIPADKQNLDSKKNVQLQLNILKIKYP
jgi:hypothetical protein